MCVVAESIQRYEHKWEKCLAERNDIGEADSTETEVECVRQERRSQRGWLDVSILGPVMPGMRQDEYAAIGSNCACARFHCACARSRQELCFVHFII